MDTNAVANVREENTNEPQMDADKKPQDGSLAQPRSGEIFIAKGAAG
jgi:hypothetical protein